MCKVHTFIVEQMFGIFKLARDFLRKFNVGGEQVTGKLLIRQAGDLGEGRNYGFIG